MTSLVSDTSVAEFAAKLAAKEPVPGGGGAAACVGALAAALCSMVGNYTQGKPAYAAVEQDIACLLADAEQLREQLLSLVEADAEAFEPLSRAYALDKADPNRAAVLEEATRAACEPPMEMMRLACRVVELLEEMGQKGSRLLLSDVGCGAHFARAALEAASVNVFVNTGSLANRAHAEALEQECDRMLGEYAPRAQALAASVTGQIRA